MDQQQFQNNMQKAQQQQQKQEEILEQRRVMLQQIMTPEAKERLNRLSLVKPEKAQKIEDMILQNASMGGIKSKIDEQTLITYLEQMNEGEKPTTSIRFKRKINEDSDEDFNF